jgi:phospholipase D1/2
MDFHNVPDFSNNDLSILESARMPWHDASWFPFELISLGLTTCPQVHMTLTGPAVLDIVQHFTERWNEIKKRKVSLSKAVVMDCY